jgi:hypothetical protein
LALYSTLESNKTEDANQYATEAPAGGPKVIGAQYLVYISQYNERF